MRTVALKWLCGIFSIVIWAGPGGLLAGEGEEKEAEKAKVAVPDLIKALGEEDKDVRINAAKSLGKLGAAAKASVPALINALGDEHKEVR